MVFASRARIRCIFGADSSAQKFSVLQNCLEEIMTREYECEYTRQSISDLLDKITLDFPDPNTTERISVYIAGEKFEAVDEIVADVFIRLVRVMVSF